MFTSFWSWMRDRLLAFLKPECPLFDEIESIYEDDDDFYDWIESVYKQHGFVSYGGGFVAAVVYKMSESGLLEEILVLDSSYESGTRRTSRKLPGGKVRHDEEPREAVQRVLFEKAGVDVQIFDCNHFVHVDLELDRDGVKFQQTFYLIEWEDSMGPVREDALIDGRETIEPPEFIYTDLLVEVIADPKSTGKVRLGRDAITSDKHRLAALKARQLLKDMSAY